MGAALLLATGVVAVSAPDIGHAAGAAAAQAQTDAAQKQNGDVKAQADPAQGQKDGAQAAPADAAQGQKEEPQAPTEGDAKLTSTPGGKALGMSILGNQEAPTSLVIVPWKTSELGGTPGISPMLDDSRQPIDKDVFMRVLRYHEMSTTTRQDGAPAGSAAQPATAAQRRK
jgi:hypothetical protein